MENGQLKSDKVSCRADVQCYKKKGKKEAIR